MAQGKVIEMNTETKKVIIETSKGKEEYKVGKKIFNERKFEVGDTIIYEIKGPNFDFKRIVSSLENNSISKKQTGNIVKQSKLTKIFSYPYNFVSLGESKNINRKSISENKGNLSGKIKCTLTNLTPLFISGAEGSSNAQHKIETILQDNGNYIIPASSLKGEIRNIVEVITNSCIKNVETERLEKREQAGTRTNIFGLIKRLPNEKMKEDGLIVEAVKIKIHKSVLEGKQPGFYLIKVNKSIGQYIDREGKKTYRRGEKDPNAINDSFVFKKVTEGGTEDAVLWISPNIYGKQYEKIIVKKDFVDKGKGRNFIFSLSEYEDLKYLINQRKERDKDEKERDKKIGIDEIQVNDSIIFEETSGKATHLAFSEIPRLRYKYSPYSLIPKAFQPCSSLKELCFACRLFGTTGNSQEEKKSSDEITAHIGRVFITDARTPNRKEKLSEIVTLKALGEPHPSLARFYLTEGSYDSEGTEIRGRKFYWHHSEKIKYGENYKNYISSITTDEKAKYNSSLSFLKPKNTFEFEVEFKNLTDEELGVLIYSLELEEGLLHKFGKAKAFGFGSSKIEIKELLLKSEDRYINFITSYKNEDCQKYKSIAVKEYILDSKKEIQELKAILSEKNNLDFSKSPFPESHIFDKKTGDINKKRGYNTLNWFMENKDVRLPNILDYKK